MQILLDTNFILTAVKQKIDIVDRITDITSESIEWIVPQDVLDELETLKDRHGMKIKDRFAARLAFDIMQTLNPVVIELSDKNPNVDIKIVNYIVNKPIVLATLDKNLKKRVGNRILTIRGKKKLEFV